MGTWTTEQIRSAAAQSTMLTWMPGKARQNLPILSHGKGVYLYEKETEEDEKNAENGGGKRYLDWTSQAVCTNIGHDVPPSVLNAVSTQLQTLPFCYGGIAMCEIRARLCRLLSDHVLPADLQGMVFPSSGAEANEAAIVLARRYASGTSGTNKYKVINWYRSYHGGTSNALQATGDFRRWYGGDTIPGFVKASHPFPLFFDLAGSNEEERTQMALNMLEEQVLNEGPDTIALIALESIVGSGGVLIPPDGYMQGVRAICDRYNILLQCDEVMVGFGRTGKMFGFQNFKGVLPDIITCAKGITSSAIPLSMVACRKHIMEYFEDKPLGWGSTYQAHPVAMACAYEQIKFLIKSDVIGNVQRLAPVFERSMMSIAEKHPCIKQYRSIGLFGCFDVMNPDGSIPQLLHEPATKALLEYKKAYAENGLIGLVRYPLLHVAPPLVISEEELLDGFERQDRALETLDRALGFSTT
jgi:taurine---2-oxoglutarate transaminase